MALSQGHLERRFRRSPGRPPGPDAEGLSSGATCRLKAGWWEEYKAWRRQDLTGKHHVHLRADGVYFKPRLDGDRQCMLVIIGADACGRKDILAIMDGLRENTESWTDLLRDLKTRGLAASPELAIGDGALGLRRIAGCLAGDTRAALPGLQGSKRHRCHAQIPP